MSDETVPGLPATKLFGLIGYPLSHSFSKKYFTDKFEREKLDDCQYELFPIPSLNELPALLKEKPGLAGLNVTIPYKRAVIPFLHDRKGIPDALDACNCIRIENGRLSGFNTDISGFEKSIKPLLRPYHDRALVLGTGGAAAAVIYVLKKLGLAVTSVSRTQNGNGVIQYKDIGKETILSHKVIVNTTPLGMYPSAESCPPLPYEFITPAHLLYDLVYNPAKTLFLKKGEDHGATIKNGEEMLVLQAEESWNIWNNR